VEDLSIFNPEVVKQLIVNSTRAQADHLNAEALKRFQGAAADWKANATIERAAGRPLPPKPEPPITFHVEAGPDGWPKWIEGPDRVAPPVPDLDPLQAQASGIGVRIGNTNFYQCLPGDSTPDGIVVTFQGGQFRKIVTPWGGIWEKIA